MSGTEYDLTQLDCRAVEPALYTDSFAYFENRGLLIN